MGFRFVLSLLSLLVVAAGCASPPTVARQSGVVFVAPMNFDHDVPDLVFPGVAIVGEQLDRYVAGKQAQVRRLAPDRFAEQWMAAVEAAGVSLRSTQLGTEGERDRAVAALAERLGREGAFDVLLLPKIVVEHQDVGGASVRWAGATRYVRITGAGSSGLTARIRGTRVPVSTLKVAAYRADGSPLGEREAGLEILSEMTFKRNSTKLTGTVDIGWENRNDLFEKPNLIDGAVHSAIGEWVPR